MSDFDPTEILNGFRGERPSTEFLDDLWVDLEAELDRLHGATPDDGPRDAEGAVALEPQQLARGPRWVRPLLLVAAASVVVGSLAVIRGPDTDDVIATRTPTTVIAETPTSVTELPTPSVPVLQPELRHAVRVPGGGGLGDPPVLDRLEEGVTYAIDRVPAALVEIPDEPALPHGWAWVPRMEDGVNRTEGGLVRELFLPAAEDMADYPDVLDEFREPTGVMPRELSRYPLVELVRFLPLGSTVEDVLGRFTTNPAVELMIEPSPATVGGLDSVTFEARTVSRAVIASGESLTGGSPVTYAYAEGLRLRVHIVDTSAGPVVVVVSTDAVAFDVWQPIAERLLDGMTFAPA